MVNPKGIANAIEAPPSIATFADSQSSQNAIMHLPTMITQTTMLAAAAINDAFDADLPAIRYLKLVQPDGYTKYSSLQRLKPAPHTAHRHDAGCRGAGDGGVA
jgi:hypothetical protein